MITQRVKWLLCKCEDLSFIPRTSTWRASGQQEPISKKYDKKKKRWRPREMAQQLWSKRRGVLIWVPANARWPWLSTRNSSLWKEGSLQLSKLSSQTSNINELWVWLIFPVFTEQGGRGIGEDSWCQPQAPRHVLAHTHMNMHMHRHTHHIHMKRRKLKRINNGWYLRNDTN